MVERETVVFTDGASRGNPGSGGFAAVLVLPKQNKKNRELGYDVVEIGGRETLTTNNRMELMAPIKALPVIHNSRFIIYLYTDSSYLLNGITKWVQGWQKNAWKTKNKKEVLNRDLWEKLVEAAKNKNIEWKLVGGHVGVAGNHRADELATAFADGKNPKLYRGSLSNYPIQNILDISIDETRKEKKTSARARSRGKAHSYVSLVDGVVETHGAWAECERRVKGVAGARFKKARSVEEEREIMREFSG